MKENVVFEKSKDFAIRIVNLYNYLCDNKKEYVLSKQILRSGTSIGANIAESEEIIEKKKAAIAELQAEINKEQQQIVDCHTALEHLADALETVRLNETEEVNG